MGVVATQDMLTASMSMVATKDEIKDIVQEIRSARQDIEKLITSVDRFAHLQGKDHDELIILRAGYSKMAETLVRKGIASEQDLRPA